MESIGADFKLDVSGFAEGFKKVDSAILDLSKRASGLAVAFAGIGGLLIGFQGIARASVQGFALIPNSS